MRLGAGVAFALGAALFVYAVLGPVREQLTHRDLPSGADLAAAE